MTYARSATLWMASSLVLFLASAFAPPAIGRGTAVRVKEFLGDLPADSIRSGILYDRAAPISRIEDHDGSTLARPTDLRAWRQIYDEMRRGSVAEPTWPDFGALIARGGAAAGGAVPIVVMDFRYDRIDPDALADGRVFVRDARLEFGKGASLRPGRVFAAAPLTDHTYRGAQARFRVDPSDWFGNTGETPLETSIDFDDGRGFVGVRPGVEIAVSYAETGRKTIRVRSRLSGGKPSRPPSRSMCASCSRRPRPRRCTLPRRFPTWAEPRAATPTSISRASTRS